MPGSLKRLWHEDEGQDLTEYGVPAYSGGARGYRFHTDGRQRRKHVDQQPVGRRGRQLSNCGNKNVPHVELHVRSRACLPPSTMVLLQGSSMYVTNNRGIVKGASGNRRPKASIT